MGKITSLVEFEGKVGNLVGAKGKDGRYTLRKYQPKPRDGRTHEQMKYRVAWANMVALWRSMKGENRPSFESKKVGWSDFNAFINANRNLVQVYLQKREAMLGVCVVAPYAITNGSLNAIEVTSLSGGKMRCNMALGDLVIDADTTVSTFSKAVLNNNEGFEEGDRITGYLLQQQLVGELQVPKVNPIICAVTLEKSNNTSLYDVVDEKLFSSTDGYLSSKSTVNGGITWVHSRRDAVSGRVLVSPQTLTVNNTLLETYMSDSCMREAIESYGGEKYRGILYPTQADYETTVVNP